MNSPMRPLADSPIHRLVHWCGRNPFLVIVAVAISAAIGYWAMRSTPLDAIPDLSDVQVIINTSWEGRNPNLVEDQVTYPIVTALLGAPHVQYIRGLSMFGESFVYVVFKDGTDLYWARSRVLEYLQQITAHLPSDAMPVLGPDATSVGWIYEYALVDTTGQNDLQQLRSFQDWYLKLYLRSTPGVADVATVGGYEKQYQVELDPNALRGYGVSVNQVVSAIRKSNNEVGARVLESNENELIVRGRGYVRSVADVESVAVSASEGGVPILVKNLGRVHLGPQIRRGVADLEGKEVVGGIVIMRDGENALQVIRELKKRIEAYQPSLPSGVKIVATYDRSDLILRSIATLREELIKLSIIVSLVCIVFLYHFRSALVAILTLPIAILLSFITMHWMGVTINIMSLGGIAIAIGAMVDAAIVMIENAQKRLERREMSGRREDRTQIVLEAAAQVGKPLFFSLLIITISFLPVFTLQAQEGRLFKPLAFTKTFAMFFASLLSVTLVPLLMVWFIRGKIRREEENPLSRFLIWLYRPCVALVLRHPLASVVIAAVMLLATVPAWNKLGKEFMPPLNEGSILYMPTAPSPSLAVGQAREILQTQDRVIADPTKFPEVERVFGKIGRAETATDPAPLSMVETVILLKPTPLTRWYSWMPENWKRPLRNLWPEDELPELGPTVEKLRKELPLPGMPVIPWMPIQTRLEMLATGVRSPVAAKVFGPDLNKIDELAKKIETILRNQPGTATAFTEPIGGAYYVDIIPRREAIARYGLTIEEVQDVIESAIGGKNISSTVEGRERYTINVRYARDFRKDPDALARVTVAVPMGKGEAGMSSGADSPTRRFAVSASGLAQIPLGELADVRITTGPPEIKDEGGQLEGLVSADVLPGNDVVGYVEKAQKAVEQGIDWSAYPGYHVTWAGQYQYWQRAKERLQIVVPFTLLIIFLLLYLNFRNLTETMIVLLSVPFALVGGVWLLFLLRYNLSVAVGVGMIALAGVAAETGVVMIVYLDEAYEHWQKEGRLRTRADLIAAVMEGAVQRLRPKMMTVAAIILGLLPLLWTQGTGADTMRRIAAPMIGGMVSSTVLTLLIIPAVYVFWKGRQFAGTTMSQRREIT